MTTGNYIIKQILIKRGNTQVTSQYVGPVGELVIDTGSQGIRVQNGVTPGGTLINAGQIGATGIQGPQGPSGPSGPTGPSGPPGATGPQGTSIKFKGTVASATGLPVTGNMINDAYLVQDEGSLYVWNGEGFDSVGSIVGPVGATGPTGATGPIGATGEVGPTGASGVDALWNFRGEYDNGTIYNEGDVITYQDETWYRIAQPDSVIGYPPGVPTAGLDGDPDPEGYWRKIAAKGENGGVGATGPQGETGATGATGPIAYQQGDPFTWTSLTAYNPNDVVVYYDNFYILSDPENYVQSVTPDGAAGWTPFNLLLGGNGVDGLQGNTNFTPEAEGDVSYDLNIGTNDQDNAIKLTIYDSGTTNLDTGGPGISLGVTDGAHRAGVIAIGNYDVGYNSKPGGVYIGHKAGWNSTDEGEGTFPQGENAIAIGTKAAFYFTEDNSITLNATGLELNPLGPGLFIKPVRENVENTAKAVYYNASTGELTYTDPTGSGSSELTHLILTGDPFIFEPYAGTLVTFTQEDYGNQVDQIDTGLSITRGTQQGIYNPLLEPDWDSTSSDGVSPAGTLWNKDGWTDLTNLNQRVYYSFYDSFLRYGNNVLTAEAIMKDVANNKYYKVDFTVWGNNALGAPVTYTRTQLDSVTGDPIGDPVTFEKPGYADPTLVNDPIDTGLTIARGNNQSIYNLVSESGYSTSGDDQDSPEGTEWNSDGWANLKNVGSRSYDTFYNTLNQAIEENVVGTELIMHDTANDKYYAIKFSGWTQSGEGGGFSYTRQLINTSNIFTKTDYGSEVDIIVADDPEGTGIGITRDENNGIYNPYQEGSWDQDISPGGTAWNAEGWTDLSNITTRIYQSFYDAVGGNLGNNVPGKELVMFIPSTGKYYAVQFSSWTQGGNGGGFRYSRYEIDLTQLNEGIRFADGTVLKSAEGIGRVKSTASGGRRIEEVVGNKTVVLTARTVGSTITSTTYQNNSWDTRYMSISWDATIGAYLNSNPVYYDIEISLDNSTWYKVNSSGWSNGNYWSIYTLNGVNLPVTAGQTVYYRIGSGGIPVVWWDKNELPGGAANFRGAVIDYHAYTGESTIIGTIHIVDDDGEEHITHTEVASGSTDGENDDLWFVENEGTISYRRIDGEGKTLKVHWTAKVFYGEEFYD